MIKEHYANLLVLQDIVHNYHIRTLILDMTTHNYLWELYSEITEHIDTIGEQIIILWDDIPTAKKAYEMSFIDESDNIEDEYDMIKALYEVFDEIKNQMIELWKDNSLTPGTLNLISDEELFFGKNCAKLKSLIKEEQEEYKS